MVIQLISIQMAAFHPFWTRTNKSKQDQFVNGYLFVGTLGCYRNSKISPFAFVFLAETPFEKMSSQSVAFVSGQ